MADVSTAPWDGSASRFDDAQWQNSSILDRGEQFTTAKTRHALPVREPDGALNRHALAAAAAALNGGRGGVDAPDSAKASARSKLNGLYRQAGLTVSKTEGDVTEWQVPVWKDDAQQIVYGVVMSPWVEDSQGDIASPAEIEKAAHAYLVQSRKSDVQHSEQLADVDTVESFVAPQDMEVAGHRVLKGAWVMAVRVNDPAVWERVRKQELTGFSIGGSAVRVPIPA